MKSLFFLFLLLIRDPESKQSAPDDFIDPTGTYLLKGNLKKNIILDHHGEIRVKLLNPKKIAISFYLNKGYPGYESGTFIDTLNYADNQVKYVPPADRSCALYIKFSRRNAGIIETYLNPHSACGFPEGVLIPAQFEKASSAVPQIQDLSAHGKLQ